VSSASQELAGHTAIVTGASEGLGLSFARALACAGAIVYVNGRREEKVIEAVETLVDQGLTARGVPGDVGQRGVIDGIVEQVIADEGRLDVLVNNAGVIQPAPLWEMTDDQWDEVIRIDLTGVFYGVRAAARAMRTREYGRIINVTSMAGIQGSAAQANYGAAKAGVIGLTKSAARQLAAIGITVNALSPAAVTSMLLQFGLEAEVQEQARGMIPMQRFAQPEEIAPALVFLASPAAGYTTGHVFLVDGGLSM
jgi:3-oxoacyl-[acyl-carrier protein] reductase